MPEWKELDKPRLYRKELVPEWSGINHQGVPISIGAEQLQHFKNKLDLFASEKIDVPIYSGHEETPETRLGEVVGSELATNQDGKRSLFVDCQFADDDAVKLALRNDVSVYSPEEMPDSKGRVHKFPVKHVAITDQPRVDGLSPWQALAASMHSARTREKTMKTICERLGIEETTDEAAIVLAIDGLKKAKAATPVKPVEKVETPAPPAAPVYEAPPGVLDTVRQGRHAVIASMIGNTITPETAKKLEAEFCSDGAIKLACMSGEEAKAEAVNWKSRLEGISYAKPIANTGRAVPPSDLLQFARKEEHPSGAPRNALKDYIAERNKQLTGRN